MNNFINSIYYWIFPKKMNLVDLSAAHRILHGKYYETLKLCGLDPSEGKEIDGFFKHLMKRLNDFNTRNINLYDGMYDENRAQLMLDNEVALFEKVKKRVDDEIKRLLSEKVWDDAYNIPHEEELAKLELCFGNI